VRFVTIVGWALIAVGAWAALRVARGGSGDLVWLAVVALGCGLLLIFGRTWLPFS
jgi:hypothetical protein